MEQTHYTVRVQRTTTEYHDYEIATDLTFFPNFEGVEIVVLDDVKFLDESNRIDWKGQEREYETVEIQDVLLEFAHADGDVSRLVQIGNGNNEEEE